MYKKFNRLAIILMITLFVLNIALAVFMIAKNAQAAGPCGLDKKERPICPPEGKIRVQVPIPGLSDFCTYEDISLVDGKAAKVTKSCYYVNSLPVFIAQVYKFSIGAIAIIAVLMIMIAGLKWIFAAGRAGMISDAKSSIYAALTGLVLALLSYAILYAINPRLVNLSLPGVTSINPIEQPETTWCSKFPTYYNQSSDTFVMCEEGKWGKGGSCLTPGPNTNFICGVRYQYGYEQGGPGSIKVELGKGAVCYGTYCAGDNDVCVVEQGYGYCANPKELCEERYKTICDDVNEMLDNTTIKTIALSKSCQKRVDKVNWTFDPTALGASLSTTGDQCVWAERIFCPEGTTRTKCLIGTEFDDDDTEIGCWKFDGSKKVPYSKRVGKIEHYCTDSNYANTEANLICCLKKNDSEDIFKLYGQSFSEPLKVDCSKINSCSDYSTAEIYNADPCYKGCK